jgi:2,3-bisphosphoglycerate-dependent phosphoglycerate mutase
MNSGQFTLHLVRHAQSANNAKPESQRIADPPLTDLGVEQARALASVIGQLSPDHLFSSPFLRTLQTTAPVAQALGILPTVRADLYEQGGCYRGHRIDDRTQEPGMRRSEIQSLHPTWQIDPAIDESGWNKHETYETLQEARKRAQRVAKWLAEHPWPDGARVLLVIHADFKIRLLESLLSNLTVDVQLGSVINTAWTSLSYQAGRWQLDEFNSHPHLEPQMITS